MHASVRHAGQFLSILVAATQYATAATYQIRELTPELLPLAEAHAREGSAKPGHGVYDDGSDVYLVRNGTSISIGHPDAFQGLIGIDGHDRIYAFGTAYRPGNAIWKWEDGAWKSFATADWFNPNIGAVNRSGIIAVSGGGASSPPVLLREVDPDYRGKLWQPGVGVTYIGAGRKSVEDPPAGLPIDINNSDDVLYWALATDRNPEIRPFFYTGGTLQELSDLVDPSLGWDLDRPTELSLLEDGFVVGEAPRNGILTKFILAPVPEPASVILTATIVIVVGLFIRRRRVQKSSITE